VLGAHFEADEAFEHGRNFDRADRQGSSSDEEEPNGGNISSQSEDEDGLLSASALSAASAESGGCLRLKGSNSSMEERQQEEKKGYAWVRSPSVSTSKRRVRRACSPTEVMIVKAKTVVDQEGGYSGPGEEKGGGKSLSGPAPRREGLVEVGLGQTSLSQLCRGR